VAKREPYVSFLVDSPMKGRELPVKQLSGLILCHHKPRPFGAVLFLVGFIGLNVVDGSQFTLRVLLDLIAGGLILLIIGTVLERRRLRRDGSDIVWPWWQLPTGRGYE